MYERLDELGIDFSVLYPTKGFGIAGIDDPEIRQGVCRGFNDYYADTYAQYADRMAPAGVIPMHTPDEAVAELGYDFTYESYVGKTDSLAIHSMRIFAGYTLKLTEASGLFANLETISNLNTERVPTHDGTNEAGPFRDTRLNGKAGISATIWKKLSVSLSATLKFDNTPAPLPPFKLPFAQGFVPIANKLDTITEAALIYNLL
jgi:hypothetical protein